MEWEKLIISNQKDLLSQAIDTFLISIYRLFSQNLEEYLELHPDLGKETYFSCCSGATQLNFGIKNEVIHTLDIDGEQLSVVVMPDPLKESSLAEIIDLNAISYVPMNLLECINQKCTDIRLWEYNEDIDSSEYKQAGISYHFENNTDLFYGIYLHDYEDSDMLLTTKQIIPDYVKNCYSIRMDKFLIK